MSNDLRAMSNTLSDPLPVAERLWCPVIREDLLIVCRRCHAKSKSSRDWHARFQSTCKLVRCEACQCCFDAIQDSLWRKFTVQTAWKRRRTGNADASSASSASASSEAPSSEVEKPPWYPHLGVGIGARPYVNRDGCVVAPASPPFADTVIDS